MGQVISMIRTSYIIGKRNKNVSALHLRFNCNDHLFPKDDHVPWRRNSELLLAQALEKFNSFINLKMNIDQHKPYTKSCNIRGIEAFVSAEKMLYRQLVSGEDTRDVVVEVGTDDRHIYLCRNHITELNSNIGNLPNITVIQTCCNYIRYIPSEIGSLINLKMLILSRNRLKCIPPEIGFCKNLKEIDLSNNIMKSLPKSILTLKNLHTLHIEGNQFEEIPSFIGKLHALKFLRIGKNPITHIPLEIFKLPFLLTINTDECRFDYTSTKFEEKLPINLQELICRKIVIENRRIKRDTPLHVTNEILKLQECAFCGGPFINSYVEVEDFYTFDSEVYPVKYRMCCKHYKDHRERIPALFEAPISTVPLRLQEDGISSITEMFEPICFSDAQKDCISRIKASEATMIPLYFLATKKTKEKDDLIADSFLEKNVMDLNVYDDELFDEVD